MIFFQVSPDYQEFDKTWLPDKVKEEDNCKFIPSQLNKGMIMPVNGGLDGCKELCNSNSECDAIEYAPSPGEGKVDCCILVKCDGSVPEPTETGEHYHPGQDYEYKGYKKGTRNPIHSPNIILNLQLLVLYRLQFLFFEELSPIRVARITTQLQIQYNNNQVKI